MQHFYTCFSGLFSNLRTSIAQVQRTRFSETYSSLRNVFARLRQSVLANSLRTVILLFVLALSCNVWGDVTLFSLDFTSLAAGTTNKQKQSVDIPVINGTTITFIGNDTQKSVTWGADAGGVNFGGKNMNAGVDQHSVRIPLDNINGTITITLKTPYGTKKSSFKYSVYSSDLKTAIVSAQTASDTDKDGIISFTLGEDKALPNSVYLFLGEGSTSYTTIKSVTVTTPSPSTQTVYLRPTNLWNADNARFAVYYWDASNTGWADMTPTSDCEKVYVAQIPANYPNIIFCRMNPGATGNNWDNKWNQTGDLSVEDGKVYTITGGSLDNYTGTWGTYVQSYSVSFNMNGHGNAVSDQCVQSGTTIAQPADPTATGYTFAGWYADAACTQEWDFSTPVTAATTLYAQWTEDLTSPVSIKGSWDNWAAEHPLEKKPGETGDVAYYTVYLTAGTYEFIPFRGDKYYKIPIPQDAEHAEAMTRARANGIEWYLYKEGNLENCQIVADYNGNYTFRINYTTTNEAGRYGVTVTYPALHTITYQEGRPAEYGSLTTFGIPTSATQVVDGGALALPNYTTIKIAAGSTTVYEFAGWSDGKTTYPANQTTIDNITSDLTLTATWQPVSFNIYYWDGQNEDNSQNKAINGLTPTTYTYASNDPLPTDAAAITNAAEKQGVVFKNWKVRDWDQTTFTLKDLDYTTPYHLYGDINLYAEWDTFCGEMMRATITGESSATLTGNYAGSAEVKVAKGNATDGYKLGKDGYFVKLTLKNATFQAGDYVVVNVITPSAYLELYADKGNTLWCKKTGVTTSENILPLPAEAVDKNTVYLYRTSESSANMNPHITYMSIVRQCCTPLTTFAWDASSATYTYGEPFTAPQLSVQSDISGTILYESSDVSVATIATDGTLTPKMPGTTTISATYEGDDFCPTTVTYTLHVVCNATAPKIVSDGTETTVGCAQTITLRAVQSTDETAYTTGTFQWYRDGEELSGSTDAEIIVKVPGNYAVAYNNGVCSVMSTNTAKVTASGSVPEVTRLARYQYFRVSGAYLESQKMRHLFRVKPTATGTPCKITVKAVQNNTETDVTGLANVMDYVSFVDNNDGTYDVMLDLNKLQTTGAITGTLSEGDILVFSCAPAACTEGTFDNAYAKSIDVRVLGADKKALAFIVSGAEGEGSKNKDNHVVGKDFIDGVNKADLYLQTGHYTVDRNQELPLLTTLKKTYHVDPVNGYAAFDPMNYEPYDLIVLTDFPQASKSIEAAKNLDAIGNMVDVRPMLSLKAHMVRDNLSNGVWKTQKGFTENAATPDPTKQTVMSILCYAHSMFDGFDSKELLDGTTWTQTDSTNALTNIMVDKDQNIYIRMLTKGGFEDSKSLQGFTAVASENFINIGTIPDKTHTSLITCCERQANLEARLMLLSINSHATSLLTEVGMKAIERILTYLLVTDPTKVSDCSIVFDNGFNPDGTSRVGCTKHDGMWNTSENWNSGLTPLPTQNVQIKADVTVVGQATAADVKIQPTKKLTIAPNGALSTNGIIGWLDPKNNATISAITDPTVITVQANENNTGALIQSDKEGKTQATIQMYSRAKGTDKGNGMVENAVWQWMTTPYKDVTHAVNTYRGAWLYTYNNSTHSWQQIYDQSPVPPFAGYSITQAQAKTYTMTGTLVPTADQTISLSNGINLIGNSWTAPINISQFKVEDFANAEATIVMFNTGIDPDGSGAVYTDENSTASQTYVSIPVNAAIAINELKVIPAMQAFQVKATAEGATLTLDYDRLVRTKQVGNSPMRAPKHNAQTLGNGINERLRISVIGKRYSDYLYLLSHEEATEGFDNGWDGEKIYSDNLNVPVIYVENAAGDWQISTQPVLAGTQFGFYRGEDDVYTIRFDYVGDETLYFYDAVADTYTEVKTGNTYSFISTTDNLERRFALTNFNPYVKPTPTDIDNTDAHSARMVRKFVLNDHVYILIDGVLYDVVGKMVR